jgi:hypothetical protein
MIQAGIDFLILGSREVYSFEFLFLFSSSQFIHPVVTGLNINTQ